MSNSLTNIESFDALATVTRDNKLVLLDLWAPWCGPCRALAPVLEEIAAETPELKVIKINIDEFGSDVTDKFGVRSIPTLILFKDGVEYTRKVGAGNKEALLQFINSKKEE